MSYPVPAAMPVALPAPRDKHGLPPLQEPYVQRGRKVLLVLVWIAAALGVAAAIALSAYTAGRGFSIVLVYALIPAVTLVAGYVWLDRYEPEPRRYVLAAFVWGAAVSTSVALALQLSVSAIWDPSDRFMATFIAPVTEEPAKCVFLVLTFLRARRVIDGFVDAIVYAGIVGLGFAFLENVGYLSIAYDGLPNPDGPQIDGVGGATATFIVRGIFSPFAHPLFTSSFAIAVAGAILLRSWWLRVPLVLVGLVGSMLLHGAWNGSVSYGGGAAFVVAYLLLAVVLAGFITAACFARRRQGRVLRGALLHMSTRGWLHPDEVPYLGTFELRDRAVRWAKHNGPDTAAPAFKRYQRIAVRAAFLYHGVMTGRPKPHAVTLVDIARAQMAELKPYLRLPPPLRRRWPHPSWGWPQQPPPRVPLPPPSRPHH